MTSRNIQLTDELYAYILAHSTPPDQVVRDLVEETHAALPEHATMQIALEQAALLTMLARLAGARRAVEVGTFTGMSALAIARGVVPDGRLTCFDISTEYTEVAQRYWQRAGVADRIDLRIGPAAERLRELPAEPHLDLAFIDADKRGYVTYWAELVPRMRPGGLLAVDNTLWSGRVVEPDPADPNLREIVAFNDHILSDDRMEIVLLPISDGLTLAQRR
jgi:caffeoyl-CoA O-methyltransferase